jgi:hypothetical protein
MAKTIRKLLRRKRQHKTAILPCDIQYIDRRAIIGSCIKDRRYIGRARSDKSKRALATFDRLRAKVIYFIHEKNTKAVEIQNKKLHFYWKVV